MQFYSDLSFTDKKLDIKYVVFAKVTLALWTISKKGVAIIFSVIIKNPL